MLPFFRVDGFLNPQEVELFRGYVRGRLHTMRRGETLPPGGAGVLDLDFQRNLVEGEVAPVWSPFEHRLLDLKGFAARQFCMDTPHAHLEKRIAVFGDGDFLRRHNDKGTDVDVTYTRAIAFVYYLNDGPYIGGELGLWADDSPASKQTYVLPRDNSVVFFPASTYHEVTDLHGVGRRYTLTGWYHS